MTVPSTIVETFGAFNGGCTCTHVRHWLEAMPLVVHCCHCRRCQRETGASFALNAMIESDRVACLAADPERVRTPSASGLGQEIARCPRCRVAVWSHYAGAGLHVAFVRVGTLDEPDRLPPDVHIFPASKQPWVAIPDAFRPSPGTTTARPYDRPRASRVARRCSRPSTATGARRGTWTERPPGRGRFLHLRMRVSSLPGTRSPRSGDHAGR